MITSMAIKLLKEAGYDVEFAYGIVYVRTTPTDIPSRLYEKNGAVSDRKLKALLNKMPKVSTALRRLIDEVAVEKDRPWGGYNRTYSRHNRS